MVCYGVSFKTPSEVAASELCDYFSVPVCSVLAGSNDSEERPPPKPPRLPAERTSPPPTPLQTYIVAQSPEVLARLMRDNAGRAQAGTYTAPASALNTVSVQLARPGSHSLPRNFAAPAARSPRPGRQVGRSSVRIPAVSGGTAARRPVFAGRQ